MMKRIDIKRREMSNGANKRYKRADWNMRKSK